MIHANVNMHACTISYRTDIVVVGRAWKSFYSTKYLVVCIFIAGTGMIIRLLTRTVRGMYDGMISSRRNLVQLTRRPSHRRHLAYVHMIGGGTARQI